MKHCVSDKMIADFFTKPLQDTNFKIVQRRYSQSKRSRLCITIQEHIGNRQKGKYCTGKICTRICTRNLYTNRLGERRRPETGLTKTCAAIYVKSLVKEFTIKELYKESSKLQKFFVRS